MSTSTPEVQTESKGSVKITRNAKGEAQFEVKAYIGDTDDELTYVRLLAVNHYRALEAEFGA
jgi:hypothetical protein